MADYGQQHEKAEEQAKRHRDNLRRRDVDRAPVAPGTLPERRCQIIRSHPASRPSSREQTILLKPTGLPTPNVAQFYSMANHAGQHTTLAIHAVHSRPPSGGP